GHLVPGRVDLVAEGGEPPVHADGAARDQLLAGPPRSEAGPRQGALEPLRRHQPSPGSGGSSSDRTSSARWGSSSPIGLSTGSSPASSRSGANDGRAASDGRPRRSRNRGVVP